MSTNKYLVKREKENGEIYLDQASATEWAEILQNNRTCPRESRRYFIRDCIVEGEEIDSIFIEVSEEEYREWHRENEIKRRKRIQDEGVVVLSLNAKVDGGEGDELIDLLPGDDNTEEDVLMKTLLVELRCKLAAWKPWANELLSVSMTLPKDQVLSFIVNKDGVTIRTAQRRKAELENFVRKFLAANNR